MKTSLKIVIPNEVRLVIDKLRVNKYEAYIVGGCVRDILREAKPNDWDVTTNAKPEEILQIFPKSFYENRFGTVTILTASKNPKLKEIEITPFRIESKYTDKRHPDKVQFAKTLADDLSRRDFTVNAMAIQVQSSPKESKLPTGQAKLPPIRRAGKVQSGNSKLKIIDPFDGQDDLKNRIIRAVGDPEKRFQEDGLRLMRAVRFAATLDDENGLWEIEEKTTQGIQKNAGLLDFISKERIKDELLKIIMSLQGAQAVEILRRLGLLKYVLPELEQGFEKGQNKHHIYQIYQHCLLSLNYACQNDFSPEVRLASLLHDIGKPKTKQGEGPNSTFYNHEIVGAKMTQQILKRLKFPGKVLEKVTKLVRYHLFYYNVDEVGESSVRRLLRKVGQEDIEELLQVRHADRIGSGVPKAEPYKLRHLKYLFDKVSQDPISAKMLKLNGNDIITILNIPPGPKVGQILSYLLSQVLSEPEKNDRAFLEQEIKKLGTLSDQELQNLANQAKKEVEQVETKRDEMTKTKYWVT